MTFSVYASEPGVESPSLCMSALLCTCALLCMCALLYTCALLCTCTLLCTCGLLCMCALLCTCALFWLSHEQLMRPILYGHLLETCEELDDVEMLNIVYA